MLVDSPFARAKHRLDPRAQRPHSATMGKKKSSAPLLLSLLGLGLLVVLSG
jgi:hypothetical protein